ncbi:uncharacterized protein BX663DRAFT_486937 [Cokeromyces recurvatus]|uniref:uncharacterized protein n=1 Tax=Cokeromyces recurvatus TaxID=90255 RepID=UPI002220BF53|nr:uncharacterized protein BX663DRAFT_486937 [Cokeromyces recurvatus]KAI7902135.1 hypothetical protein BX663DRAFT_486937 [Cokeromyces recurvatus]
MPASRGINNQILRPVLSPQQVEELGTVVVQRELLYKCTMYSIMTIYLIELSYKSYNHDSAYTLYQEVSKNSAPPTNTDTITDVPAVTAPPILNETQTTESDSTYLLFQSQHTVEALTYELNKAREEINFLKDQLQFQTTPPQFPQIHQPQTDERLLDEADGIPITVDPPVYQQTSKNDSPWHHNQRLTRLTRSLYTDQQTKTCVDKTKMTKE